MSSDTRLGNEAWEAMFRAQVALFSTMTLARSCEQLEQLRDHSHHSTR